MSKDWNMPTLLEARQTIEDSIGLTDHQHTIYVGETEPESGKPAIVVEVGKKLTTKEIKARSGAEEIPKSATARGQVIPTQVIESPMPQDRRLRLDSASAVAQTVVNAQNRHQGCFNCPIPGGAQIAPEGANWVGTLGCAFGFPDGNGGWIYGGLTNYHVAVKRNARKGDRMLQPGGRGDYFGTLHSWKDLDFSRNGRNLIDAALIDCRRTGGKYGELTDTVGPSQVEVGPYTPAPVLEATVGMNVIKSGRTTGVTRGRVIGVGSSTRVGYGNGTATFVDQIILQGHNRRDMSAGGDSGSLIMLEEGLKPLCLLFAGGGGTTIANPIKHVLEWSKGKFFGQS